MGRKPIIIEWDGQRRERRVVITELWAAGVPIAEIARRLEIPYQTAYQVVHPPASVSRPVPQDRAVADDRPAHDPGDAIGV